MSISQFKLDITFLRYCNLAACSGQRLQCMSQL